MLTLIKDLPEGLTGIEAHQKVSGEDYREVLDPILAEAHKQGRKIKFLYHFCSDFDGFTLGAAWNDLKVGLQYLRLFERCALVTESRWIEHSAAVGAFLMPCPVQVFHERDLQTAISWLQAPPEERHVEAKLLADQGVLLLEPKASLTAEDFEHIAALVDPYLDAEGKLNGVVVHARSFPGWESLGGLIRHASFVREHHRRVRRVAVAADGAIFNVVPKLASHFVAAEVKTFGFDDLKNAMTWASQG